MKMMLSLPYRFLDLRSFGLQAGQADLPAFRKGILSAVVRSGGGNNFMRRRSEEGLPRMERAIPNRDCVVSDIRELGGLGLFAKISGILGGSTGVCWKTAIGASGH